VQIAGRASWLVRPRKLGGETFLMRRKWLLAVNELLSAVFEDDPHSDLNPPKRRLRKRLGRKHLGLEL
tara:strand:- start:481 stop:684 length:204 start_codon:yes stop_codon:yes gene_type:complete